VSSGLEGVFVVLDLGSSPFLPGDGDHIEAAASLKQPMLFEPDQCCPGQLLLLGSMNSLRGMASSVRRPRLDFHKDNRLPIQRNQVDFSYATAGLSGQNPVSQTLQVAGGCPFTTITKELS